MDGETNLEGEAKIEGEREIEGETGEGEIKTGIKKKSRNINKI